MTDARSPAVRRARARRGPARVLLAALGGMAAGLGLARLRRWTASGARREMEMERAGAEARLQAIVDSALEAIVTTDARGRVVGWNRHAEGLFGWSEEEVRGRTLEESIIPPRYREAHRRGMEHYLATGEGPILNRRIEIDALRRDGGEFPVELTVAPARWGSNLVFSSFIRDISERRLAERRLAVEHAVVKVLAESRSLEEAAPRVLESIGRGLGWELGVFWVVDEADGVLRCAETWSTERLPAPRFIEADRATVFAPGEGLPGRVWASREPHWIPDIEKDTNFPRAKPALESSLRSALAFAVLSGEEFLGVVEFFNEARLEPDSGLLEMLAALGSGIGESMRRIQAEEQRDAAMARIEEANAALARRNVEEERARRAAEEANRAKSDFLANMSHELRTPLNAIMGYTELLELELQGPLTEGQRSQVERVRISSRHLLGMIDDVLDLAKVEAGRLAVDAQRAPLGEVVEAAVAGVEPQAGTRGVELHSRCEEDHLQYLGDAGRVRQVLLNLLSNAVKFTPEGGRVTVHCGVAAEPDAEAAHLGRGPWTFVRVEDTGIGIAPEEIEAVFEPFVQAEMGRTRAYGGTGLGLTISRQLARLMGGEVSARSEEGRGSCFTLWLPTSAPGALPEPPTGAAGTTARVSQAIAGAVDEIVGAVNDRLRADPRVPRADALPPAELIDHQPTYLAELGQVLEILAAGGGPALLRDGSDVQRLIAARHGAQRARHGWTEAALRREFEILREEIAAAVRGRVVDPEPEDLRDVLATVDQLLVAAERVALQELRTAPAAPER